MTSGIFGKSKNHNNDSQVTKVKIVTQSANYTGLLQVILIVVKLSGLTDIAKLSWFWIFAPTWGFIALALVLVLIFLFIVGLMVLFVGIGNFFSKRKNLKDMMKD